MLKPIRMEIRIKNNVLITERESLQLTQRKMAKFVGLSMDDYTRFETCKLSPVDDEGEWTRKARVLSTVLGIPEAVIFPEVVQAIENSSKRVDLSEDELKLLTSSSAMHMMGTDERPKEIELVGDDVHELLSSKEFRRTVKMTMYALTPREHTILCLRFGILDEDELTLTEIGAWYCLHISRVSAIEATALRKLRHPSLTKLIKGEREISPEFTAFYEENAKDLDRLLTRGLFELSNDEIDRISAIRGELLKIPMTVSKSKTDT